jgi:hypothetical protein
MICLYFVFHKPENTKLSLCSFSRKPASLSNFTVYLHSNLGFNLSSELTPIDTSAFPSTLHVVVPYPFPLSHLAAYISMKGCVS